MDGGASIDAVAGTQLADYQNAPVLLARPTCMPAPVRIATSVLDTNLSTVLGGGMSHSAGTTRC
ncbi:cell wall-binding repeat-containing protein [Ornithinimicrobium sp. INDO-MA30-4]|uniref:cell wall-binding repeat-containing protein n=1 Tax=Ornithinimicrobium sp. INDO-MA30-4 TaxID=2908651 RepID=UPI001F3A42B5|nr:cell wall-binding repeat-containing protein [Ornithinimicrobium sp. INDO-MA30-4]UJH69692.1 cell wall-binding repeat-containing protein [Ornithinimicrobium sp. INDO-MA30-4]